MTQISVKPCATDAPAARRRALLLNGGPVDTAALTLAALLDEFGYGGAKVATAVNGDFVPERARTSRLLAADDRIEVVAPRQGG